MLLDGNALIALAVNDHVHHIPISRWFVEHDGAIASCPITQGTLLRHLIRRELRGVQAQAILAGVTSHPRHTFWSEDLGFGDVDLSTVIGHRQVTDAYLAALARHRRGRLATFDKGLAALHPDVTELVPVG